MPRTRLTWPLLLGPPLLWSVSVLASGSGKLMCEILENGKTASGTVRLMQDESEVATASCGRPIPIAPGSYTAVLRMLEMFVRGAASHGKLLSMCGDMAADAFVLPIVLGLGYRSLSVPVAALPLVREVLRRIDSTHARAVATQALDCSTADEVVWLVATNFARELGELWTEAGIETPPG